MPSSLLTCHPHQTSLDSALKQLQTLYEDDPTLPTSKWILKSKRSGVFCYERPSAVPGELMPFVRGDGVITGWDPEEIVAVLTTFDSRRQWDERFDQGEYVKRYENKTWLAHYTLKGSFPVTHRDLSVVISQHVDPQTGTFYLYSCSVVDPLIPPMAGCVRANLQFAGWILRPLPAPAKAIQATYIVWIEIKGALPQTMLQTLTQSLANSVNTVTRYLNRWGFPTYLRCDPEVQILAERYLHRGGVYELVFRSKPLGWSVEIHGHSRVYAEGVVIEVRSRAKVEWQVHHGGEVVQNTPGQTFLVVPLEKEEKWKVQMCLLDNKLHLVHVIIRRKLEEENKIYHVT